MYYYTIPRAVIQDERPKIQGWIYGLIAIWPANILLFILFKHTISQRVILFQYKQFLVSHKIQICIRD